MQIFLVFCLNLFVLQFFEPWAYPQYLKCCFAAYKKLTKYPEIWKQLYDYYLKHSATFVFSADAISRSIPDSASEQMMSDLVKEIMSGSLSCNSSSLKKWVQEYTDNQLRMVWMLEELPELVAVNEKKTMDHYELDIDELVLKGIKYKDNPDIFPLASSVKELAVGLNWANIPLENVKQILSPLICHPEHKDKYSVEYFQKQIENFKDIKILNEVKNPLVCL